MNRGFKHELIYFLKLKKIIAAIGPEVGPDLIQVSPVDYFFQGSGDLYLGEVIERIVLIVGFPALGIQNGDQIFVFKFVN